MKNFFILLLTLTVIAGCKKLKEDVGEDIIIKAMTDGQWRVTKFNRGGNDVTADFSPYLFQFRANNTVEALKQSTIEQTGSWLADPIARTISSEFNISNPTLSLLNGKWQITNNSWTFVEATQTVNNEFRMLRLDK